MHDGLPFQILVAEDDPDDQLLLNDAFLEIGYAAEVKKFPDGNKLLDYLHAIDVSLLPSLIVLDNTLPGRDALEVLTTLKSHARLQSIPVVVYSTSVSAQKKSRLLEAGALGVIEKGDTMGELVKLARQFKGMADAHQKDL